MSKQQQALPEPSDRVKRAVDLYLSGQVGATEAARMAGCHRQAIYAHIARSGIKIQRTRSVVAA